MTNPIRKDEDKMEPTKAPIGNDTLRRAALIRGAETNRRGMIDDALNAFTEAQAAENPEAIEAAARRLVELEPVADAEYRRHVDFLADASRGPCGRTVEQIRRLVGKAA